MARKILLAFGVSFSTILIIVTAVLLVDGAPREAAAQEPVISDTSVTAGTLRIVHPMEIRKGEPFIWAAVYLGPLTPLSFSSDALTAAGFIPVTAEAIEGQFSAVAPTGQPLVTLTVTVLLQNPVAQESITGSVLIPIVDDFITPTVEIDAPDMIFESHPAAEYRVLTNPSADDVEVTVTVFGQDGAQIDSAGPFSFGPTSPEGILVDEFDRHRPGTVEIEATATFFANDPLTETAVVMATKITVLVERDDGARKFEVDGILALLDEIRDMGLLPEELGFVMRILQNDRGLDQARDDLMMRDLVDLELIDAHLNGKVLIMGSNATAFGGEMDDSGADAMGALRVSQEESATPIEQVIENLFGEFESIFAWDATAQAFISFRPNLPAALNSLQELRPGDAVWVSVTQPNGAVWDSPLIDAAREVPLREGFNFVTWTGPAGTQVAEAVESFGDALEAVFFWDRDTQSFLTFRPALPESLNTLLQLPLQSAMWVLVSEDAVWSQPARDGTGFSVAAH